MGWRWPSRRCWAGTILSDASPSLIGSAEAVAAGAVLAVVSIAVIPYAFSEVNSLVASATMAGFIAATC